MKWHQVFRYRDGKLFWNMKPADNICVGDEAGCPDGRGYLQVRYRGRIYRTHRIIYEMSHGEIPIGFDVDHVNGVRSDNRVDNLRIATRSQNNRNACKPRTNTSGLKGVYFNKERNKWTAQIGVYGKIKNLGRFDTKELAYAARLAAENELHGEFAATETRKLVAKIA